MCRYHKVLYERHYYRKKKYSKVNSVLYINHGFFYAFHFRLRLTLLQYFFSLFFSCYFFSLSNSFLCLKISLFIKQKFQWINVSVSTFQSDVGWYQYQWKICDKSITLTFLYGILNVCWSFQGSIFLKLGSITLNIVVFLKINVFQKMFYLLLSEFSSVFLVFNSQLPTHFHISTV